MLPRGIIVSVQGWSQATSEEMVIEIANAGAVAIRTDKKIIALRLLTFWSFIVNPPGLFDWYENNIQ